MTQDVRPCPKCGSANIDADDNEVDGVVCVDCGFWMDYHPIGRDETLDLWNERPLEDALRSEIARLNAYADKLADALPEGGLPQDIETRRAANFALAQENHELRAEVARLRADNDYLRQRYHLPTGDPCPECGFRHGPGGNTCCSR